MSAHDELADLREREKALVEERDGWEANNAALSARVLALEEKGRAFVAKLDEVTPAIEGMFVFGAIHGNKYEGPNHSDELAALRALLAGGGESEGLLTACSVRGDTVHARRPNARDAVCGEENVNVTDDEFQPDSVWSCKRCLKKLGPAPVEPEGEGA